MFQVKKNNGTTADYCLVPLRLTLSKLYRSRAFPVDLEHVFPLGNLTSTIEYAHICPAILLCVILVFTVSFEQVFSLR